MNNSATKNTTNTDEISTKIEMLNYYQNEFIYRHTHYWNITIKFFLLSTLIAILPITSSALGIEVKEFSSKWVLLCFPLIALIITVLSAVILREETKRMNAVNKTKYRINRTLPDKYQYEYYEKKSSKKWMAQMLSKMSFFAQILIIICVALIIVLFY